MVKGPAGTGVQVQYILYTGQWHLISAVFPWKSAPTIYSCSHTSDTTTLCVRLNSPAVAQVLAPLQSCTLELLFNPVI